MQPGLPIQPQSTQIHPNIPQQQQVGANQTSPLLAQQLAGRPPVPGQQVPGMVQGQPGTMMQQQRPTLLQDQQIRANIQAVAQNAATAQAATPTTSNVGEGPSVSSEDLEGLDKDVGHELGDLGMGDGDLLDMGDDFDIFGFTDALDELDDMPAEDSKATTGTATSGSETSAANNTPSSSASSTGTTNLVTTTVTVSTSVPIASSAANTGMANPAGRLVTQPPPYTAAGSVNVALRGVLPQGTAAGGMPGAPTTIVRGPPPPYPGPGLAPNSGGPSNIQSSKVGRMVIFKSLNFSFFFEKASRYLKIYRKYFNISCF